MEIFFDRVFQVTSSLTGHTWAYKDRDERLSQLIAQRYELHPIMADLLASRHIHHDDVPNFIEPTLRHFLPDPDHLLGMGPALERIIRALGHGEKICIFGDYDVDGATSSALLVRYFRALGHNVDVYIPDRITEGYGPTIPAMDILKNRGNHLMITVDCGTMAFDPLAHAQKIGLDTIVLDHHTADAILPPAVSIINPNRLDQDSPLGNLAAVGVCFIFCVALNRALRADGFFKHRPEPDLMQFLDLVALGTVCDVVPLTGLNRAFVRQGLKVLQKMTNPGLKSLAQVARIQERITAYHLGFVLGPRINAGGRVGQADLGSQLLHSDDPMILNDISKHLDQLNEERRMIQDHVYQETLTMAMQSTDHCLMLHSHDWHPGVIGIVAGRLKDQFYRPVAVISTKDGIGKASCRSISGFDFGSAVHDALHNGLLLAGGGHKMAAGFTIDMNKFDDFRAFMNDRFVQIMGSEPMTPKIYIDSAITIAAATSTLMDQLDQLEPFGSGNPTPRFAMGHVHVMKKDIVGMHHIRFFVRDATGATMECMAFRAFESPLGDTLMTTKDKIHIVGTLRRDVWNDQERIKFFVDDIAIA